MHGAAESQRGTLRRRATSYKPFAWEVAPLKACSLAVDWNQIVLGAVAPVPSPVVGGETSGLGGAGQMAPPASSLVVSPLLEISSRVLVVLATGSSGCESGCVGRTRPPSLYLSARLFACLSVYVYLSTLRTASVHRSVLGRVPARLGRYTGRCEGR